MSDLRYFVTLATVVSLAVLAALAVLIDRHTITPDQAGAFLVGAGGLVAAFLGGVSFPQPDWIKRLIGRP